MRSPEELARVSRDCISTIQCLYSMLRFFLFWLNKRMPQGPNHAKRQAARRARPVTWSPNSVHMLKTKPRRLL